MPDRIKATTFDQEELRRIISSLTTGRQIAGTNVKGRFKELHDEILVRDQHFYNQPIASPKFTEPFERAQTFQSDVLRDTYSKGRSRMLEHPPLFTVKPKRDVQDQRDAANAVERYFQDGFRELEERLGYRIQGHLFHGQAVHAFGVLHWRDYTEMQPEMPELEEADELPEGKDAARYRERYEDEGEGPKYRETERSRLDRYKRMQAEAPFSWWFDVPRADVVGFIEDRSLINGMALVVTVESVGLLDYSMKIRETDRLILSVNQFDRRISIYQEQDRPENGDPSGGDTQVWGDLRIAHVWTRSECYELAAHNSGYDWTLVKSWKHDYGMPPFALARAGENNHPDPLYRWTPWMLGLFRTKPQYDYERSLGRLLAEQTAIPRYWIELAPGTFMLDDNGNRRVFSESAALAESLPAGAKLVKADIGIDPAYVQFLAMSKEDVDAATPETGFVEVGASTQPHTLVMAQSQSNTEIADLKSEQARALRIAFQNVLDTMAKRAREGEPFALRDSNDRVIELDGDVLSQLTVEVDIEPNSGAQQVAANEYYRGLLNDPKAMFSVREYLDETGDPDPDRTIQSWFSEKAEFAIMPQIAQQELAKKFGDAYVLTPGGTAVGMDGAPANPWDVLIEAGFQRPAPPPQPPGADQAVMPMGQVPQLQPMDAGPTGASGLVMN